MSQNLIPANTGKKRSAPVNQGATSRTQAGESPASTSAPLRWKPVIEAPDSNPRPRGAARPRRGRPRKYPIKPGDEKQKDERVNIIRWQPPNPVYHQPPPGAQILQWACQWPELLQFYMTNTDNLDPSGNNLYSATRYRATTGSFYNAFQTSPATLTLRILFAEAARVDRRSALQRLLWLKGQALTLVNEGLRDPSRQLSASALSDVVTLHNYEQVFGTQEVARLHRKGVLALINMMGGIENVKGEAAILVPIIIWTDRSRQARRLWDPTEDPPEYPLDFEPGLQPLHPLNIALLPPDQLGSSHSRAHALGVSLLGPGVRLMVALEALERLCTGTATCYQMYDRPEMANGVKEKITQAEQGLLAMQRDPEAPGESAFFTSPKYVLQQLIFEAARLSGLVIIRLIYSQMLERSESSHSKLDHAVMRLGMVNVSPLLDYYPRILIWLLFIQGPWHSNPTRSSHAFLAGQACANVGLSTWEAVRNSLSNIYYYPEIQDGPCFEFWHETLGHESKSSAAGSRETSSVPDETWKKYQSEST